MLFRSSFLCQQTKGFLPVLFKNYPWNRECLSHSALTQIWYGECRCSGNKDHSSDDRRSKTSQLPICWLFLILVHSWPESSVTPGVGEGVIVLVPGKNYPETGIKKKYMVKPRPFSKCPYKLKTRIFEYFFPGTSSPQSSHRFPRLLISLHV